MEQKEKLNVLFTEKYEHNVLSHFIADREYCAKADSFIKTILSDVHPAPHEITCDCLLWKTKELPLLAIKGDTVDTTRALMIYEGKGLFEFVFNSTKCHYSFCSLHSVHRVERTDYSLIIVTQNAVVPCAEIIIFGKYQFSYRFNVEGHKEVEELDKFLAKLKNAMMK
jgi:hypothetical protein